MKFRILKFTGVVIGLIGALGLVYFSDTAKAVNGNVYYALLVILATICYATNINFIKDYLKEVNAVNITSFGFLFIGPAAGVYLFTTDFMEITTTKEDAPLHLFYIALLAIFGTAIAVMLFNMLIKKVSAVFSSSVTYIIPIFAIFWGLIDGETILVNQFLFIAIILIGVYIVNKDNRLERNESK